MGSGLPSTPREWAHSAANKSDGRGGNILATRGAGAEREKKKRTPYIRSETEKSKKQKFVQKRGPTMVGLEPTWV
jgi:hypothetical protein